MRVLVRCFSPIRHRAGYRLLYVHGASFQGCPRQAAIARLVVIADFVFTATAVVLQPMTGLAPLKEPWIVLSIALYIAVGLCWLPVVFIQIRMRDIAQRVAKTGKPLPREYRDLFRVWFWLGWPAFCGVIGIFGLMVWQPRFG